MTVKRFKLPRNYKQTKQPLTKRARRQAKKLFPKTKQLPAGMEMLYEMHSQIDTHPVLPPHVIKRMEEVNLQAIKLFRKPYSKLSSVQQTRVHESMNESGIKETVH